MEGLIFEIFQLKSKTIEPANTEMWFCGVTFRKGCVTHESRPKQ